MVPHGSKLVQGALTLMDRADTDADRVTEDGMTVPVLRFDAKHGCFSKRRDKLHPVQGINFAGISRQFKTLYIRNLLLVSVKCGHHTRLDCCLETQDMLHRITSTYVHIAWCRSDGPADINILQGRNEHAVLGHSTTSSHDQRGIIRVTI